MTRADEQIDVFLQPGDWFVADAGYRIRTLLGSCVSISLWHPPSRIGGMSHFVLPSRGAATAAQGLDARYGDEALAMMVSELQRCDVRAAACQAKIFGGGNMFPGHTRPDLIHVGQRNGEAAREMLAARGIPVVGEHLFGLGHRQLVFDIASGDVWMHQVQPAAAEADDAETG